MRCWQQAEAGAAGSDWYPRAMQGWAEITGHVPQNSEPEGRSNPAIEQDDRDQR
jgi:hypothetical protein